MISRILTLLAIVAFISVQGRSVNEDVVRNRYEKWVKDRIEGMNNQVNKAHKELEDSLKNAIENSKEEIESIANDHINILRASNIHQQCMKEGLVQLDEIKTKYSGSFFTCGNLTTAVEDVGLMGLNVLVFTSKTLIYMDDILNGMRLCTWDYYIPPIWCYFKYLYKSATDMGGFLGEIKTLLTSISVLINDINKQIAYCKSGSVDDLNTNALSVIENAHICSRNYIN